MFTHAYLEEIGYGRLRPEESLVREVCIARGIPVTLYTAKKISRRQVPLSRDTFICGDMDAMHGAMRQLEIPVPAPDDYPTCLAPFLHRRVWKTTLGQISDHFYEGAGTETFVKPASRRKNFTGRVFSSAQDLDSIAGTSRHEDVWCSEIVPWTSEYRVYVVGETVVAVSHYQGDHSVKPCLETLQKAIVTYRASGGAPAAYGIDFGVLSTGQTALVEVNDGYSLGAYEIPAPEYTELLFTRWRELLDKS